LSVLSEFWALMAWLCGCHHTTRKLTGKAGLDAKSVHVTDSSKTGARLSLWMRNERHKLGRNSRRKDEAAHVKKKEKTVLEERP
jgi:hypothetical protein